jgi:predicted DNA-binding transcriptional regulator YafY
MARKRSSKPKQPDVVVTAERAARLCRILKLLGKGPQKRDSLTANLKVGVRDFYRDLKVLREIGITVRVAAHRYLLDDDAQDAMARLPFPDPRLTLGEARQLAKGRSNAHKKLRQQISKIAP